MRTPKQYLLYTTIVSNVLGDLTPSPFFSYPIQQYWQTSFLDVISRQSDRAMSALSRFSTTVLLMAIQYNFVPSRLRILRFGNNTHLAGLWGGENINGIYIFDSFVIVSDSDRHASNAEGSKGEKRTLTSSDATAKAGQIDRCREHFEVKVKKHG